MARNLRMTEEAYAARMKRNAKPQAELAKALDSLMKRDDAKPVVAKYRNVKTEVDGIKFDSKKEAARYSELKLLEKAGEISDLELQTRFPMEIGGVLVCTYVADFTYIKRGENDLTIEDVKSDITRKNRAYRIKVKLLNALTGYKPVEI